MGMALFFHGASNQHRIYIYMYFPLSCTYLDLSHSLKLKAIPHLPLEIKSVLEKTTDGNIMMDSSS